MFSFGANKKTVDLYPYIRRICDLTTPNLSTGERAENRLNRAIPTLICPWEKNQVLLEECSICLTSDLADGGVGLMMTEPFHAPQAVVGYWIANSEMSEPWYFVGDLRHVQPVGGGFWSVGIALSEYANKRHQRALAPLQHAALQLLPPDLVTA